jgi:hypothetical protein
MDIMRCRRRERARYQQDHSGADNEHYKTLAHKIL